jgi:hypothetical protein
MSWLLLSALSLASPQHPLQLSLGPSVIIGSLDRSLIERVLHHHGETLEACVPAGSTEARTSVVSFLISPDGTTSRAAIVRSDFEGPEPDDCLLDALTAIQFPTCKGGGIVLVRSMPLHFTPRGH